MTDAAGAKVDEYDYDAYGKSTAQLVGVPQPFGYTARELDVESDLMQYRARSYASGLGRFMQEDPKGLGAGDLNTFRYTRNSPVRLSDPTGTEAEVYGAVAGNAVTQAGRTIPVAKAISCILLGVADALRVANSGETITSSPNEITSSCAAKAKLNEVPQEEIKGSILTVTDVMTNSGPVTFVINGYTLWQLGKGGMEDYDLLTNPWRDAK